MAIPRTKKKKNKHKSNFDKSKMFTWEEVERFKEKAIKLTQISMLGAVFWELKCTPEEGVKVIMSPERWTGYLDDPIAGLKVRDIAESIYKASEGQIDLLEWGE